MLIIYDKMTHKWFNIDQACLIDTALLDENELGHIISQDIDSITKKYDLSSADLAVLRSILKSKLAKC